MLETLVCLGICVSSDALQFQSWQRCAQKNIGLVFTLASIGSGVQTSRIKNAFAGGPI